MTERRIVAVLVLLLCWIVPLGVSAHGFRPGVLTLTEQRAGVFTVAWTAPVDTQRPHADVEVVFPEACHREADRLDCRPAGLQGEIVFEGLEKQRAPVATLVRLAEGRSLEAMIRPDDPRWTISGSGDRPATAWIELGVDHIFGGLDHLAFVLGLLLVVGIGNVRRLVLTITAFTVAHSITLALAVMGVLTLAAAPVEATIAASVLLVAREGTHQHPTITRRTPWAVALVFGLVHGLGFAGALRSAGLDPSNVGSSLLLFNVGVELGQLAVVFIAVGAVRLLPASADRLRLPACYAIGALAAWWLCERTLAIVTAAS